MARAESEDDKPRLTVVVGPTASGKSTLAAQLARRMNGEVISADSVQVYRHFDCGSGKPTAEEQALAVHHLVDVCDPLEPLEAQVWAAQAARISEEIRQRGKTPIVCGGTFLWVRALVYGLAEAPPGDAALRARHQAQAEAEGRAALHARLGEVDAASASRLHPNDLVRVSRALEVFELTGRSLSEIQQAHGFREARYAATLVSVDWNKEAYETRLAARVRAMLESGWRDEVRDLLARGYGEARAMEAVGYRQVRDAVLGDAPPSDEDLATEIIRVTRIFARRQRTWLRDEPQERVPSVALTEESLLDEWATKLLR